MNLNKLRVLFHWNQIFFFRQSQLHCLPFPALLMRISCICSHCIAIFTGWCTHRLHALLCFLSSKFIFSYIICKELRGLTMLLLLSCWIIAGKIQYKLFICMFYEFQNQFISFCNHITLSMLNRKRSKWIIFFCIHTCL